jgi:selenide,water dikinase
MTTRSAAIRSVVLVGGGHAHVQVLRQFEMNPPPDAHLTIVLDVPVAVYSGMVPGFVAGQYRAEELEIDVVPLARRAAASVILSPATGIDAEQRQILFADRPPIPYDVASLDIGSTVAGLDLPGVHEHALPTRPISRFVSRVDEIIEEVGSGNPGCRYRVVIVGGGAGGVELAFTLEQRLNQAGADPEVTLVNSGSKILAGYPDSLARRTERNATARGIEIRPGTRVAAAETGTVLLADGDRLPCDLLVWVTGAVSHDLLRTSGLPTDSRGFVHTRSTLQVEGHDNLFAVGDCGTLIDFPETPKAGVYAVRQGPYVAENIRRHLAGRSLERYRPQHDFLTLLNLGDGSALGAKWGISFEGPWVMRLKDRIDRKFMRRFQVLDLDGRPTEEFAGEPAMAADSETPCGGCAAKLGQEPLSKVLAKLPLPPDDVVGGESAEVFVELGLSAPDDAAIWHTSIGTRVGASVDLFSAFSDDPYLVGRVAVVNALSDLWATGVTPRVAQALVALPERLDRSSGEELLFQVLAGARRELDLVGVSLAGGHTTTAPERLLVGFSVEGEVEFHEVMRKGGLRPGDALVLTKPLGTGVVFRADMSGLARGPWILAATASMVRHNRDAAQTAIAGGATAMTDVTGFGLAGHLSEMLGASGVSTEIDLAALPVLPGAIELLGRGVESTFHPENARLASQIAVTAQDSRDPRFSLLFDPQTSGGLLFGIATDRADSIIEELRRNGDQDATVIGRVLPPRDDKLFGVRS